MDVGLGVLHLSHAELFALTPFQFKQLHQGWIERERIEQVRTAQLMVTIANANRWDEKQKEATIQEILPWYNEYAGIKEPEDAQPLEYMPAIPRKELLLDVTRQLLEQRGYDPDEVDKDSEEYAEAANIAEICVGPERTEDAIMVDGVVLEKADPSVWGKDGKPPWEVLVDKNKR